jgi:hypothetical protein
MNKGQALYVKLPNGRYKVWGHHQEWHGDTMKPGQLRLEHCAADGSRRYRYDVAPDTAAFLAAADVAAVAMEKAIREAAKMQLQGQQRRLTARQQAVMREVRRMMDEAGLLAPMWWGSASDRDIATAGIAAVRAVHEQQQDAQTHAIP